MLTLRSGAAAGLLAQVALLAVLETTVGLSGLGWAVGLACGLVVHAAVALALARGAALVLGPADRVTLGRAVLAGGVAALTADAFLLRQPAVAVLVAMSVVALVLDAVDGWIARRTRTASEFGARFDGEVDALLILVLSVYVARSLAAWVLLIGLARYAFAAAGWALPWLRARLPYRYWRKVVTATAGIVLTAAAADVAPRFLTYAALLVALVLMSESFGRDVWWLWRHRGTGEALPVAPARRWHPVAAGATNTLALLVVWFALVAPNQPFGWSPSAFLRIPVEALVLAGLAVVLPARGRRAMAVVVGMLLGVLTILKILDIGFFAAFDRPFNVVTDRGYAGSGVAFLTDTFGAAGATVAVVAAVLVVLAVLIGTAASVRRLAALVARHPVVSVRTVTVLVAVWLLSAITGLQVGPGEPIASTSAGRLAVTHARAVAEGVRDDQRFEAAAAVDRFRGAPGVDLLAGLRGKDVLLVFVESYGRVALEGAPSSARVRAVLDDGTRRLRASGYSSRSAFLTSPTFGGLSWLAHATLQSGLWVDNQQRYDALLADERMTLSGAFGRAGWRTVGVMPQHEDAWIAGMRFYGFDGVYDGRSIEYAGPHFGWAAMPDQYVLSAFQGLELSRDDDTPVMAEIDLLSSHAPWTAIPRMLRWNRLGDGSVYHRIHKRESKEELWRDPDAVKAGYIEAITYSLSAVISFVEKYGDDDLVVVLLGDHQPAAIVSGHGVSHDVPITVLAHDPAVIDRISAWGWQLGMRPAPDAPVWPMDAFRDRFLAAFSPRLPPTASAQAASSTQR